jgi:uncharacterized secreted protein with C-terminal beta-propeller domain
MKFTFLPELPSSFEGVPILVSGPDTERFQGIEYVAAEQDGNIIDVYEIRYETWGGPFKEACILNDILAIGLYQFLYLFDLKRKQYIRRYEMAGYFGHLYLHNNRLYVTDSGNMYCITPNSNIVWENRNLGIDGVLVEEFQDDYILGSGEWDPPGGWVDFKLDINTGKQLKKNSG